jgi:predicted DNA-binding transcriptional regulator YafY
MAKKRTSRPKAEPRAAVTAERFTRLYRLLNLLAAGPQTRARLTRSLKLDMRGFYRDLELLRKAGITIALTEGRYALAEDVEDALARLPFPDPLLTLGEALQLARGRTAAHRKLRGQIEQLRP